MRTALWLRSGGRCEFCGDVFRGAMELHHRRLRSQGGQDTADNLAAIHPECHLRAHRFPAQSREWGWIVPSWEDPAEVEVRVVRPGREGPD
jgi:5-methylcytosine-specific restriction endonuclease McrA